MNARPAIIELVVSDMAATLAFYRRLGLDIPPEADAEPHVGLDLDGGMSLMWDTEDTIIVRPRLVAPERSRPPRRVGIRLRQPGRRGRGVG